MAWHFTTQSGGVWIFNHTGVGHRKCRTPHGQFALERPKSLLVLRQCRGHPSVAIVLQSGSAEHVETYGDFTPGSAGSLIGKMGMRPLSSPLTTSTAWRCR